MPPLVKALKLISRSPALVLGSGTDKPIDSAIGDGKEGDTQPGDLPVVPIDAIPVIMMAMPPLVDPDLKFTIPQNGSDTQIGGTPNASPDGSVQRGGV